jgi:predicted DNA-binding transcriptional regulator YafY
MRSEKPADLLKLARALAASAEGMTLDEMAEFSKVGRRTIERRRDAIEDVFGPLGRIEDARQIRFRMNGRGLGSFAVAPSSEELAELENAVRACIAARDNSRAEILSFLHRKIRASLRGAEHLRLDTDIDAQLRAEAFARQVGPRPYADPKVLKTLREALLAGVMEKFLYVARVATPHSAGARSFPTACFSRLVFISSPAQPTCSRACRDPEPPERPSPRVPPPTEPLRPCTPG